MRKLFIAELIDLKLAALLGRDDPRAARAVEAIKSVSRNGDDGAYRRQVNATIRKVFAKRPPTARQANDHDMETWAAEIKVRAQRRIGEISLELQKSQHAGPGRGKKKPLPPSGNGFTKTVALREAGLSTQAASRCEQIAA